MSMLELGVGISTNMSPVTVPSNPRPAATVVVLRDGPAGPEVFMVRRHENSAFMGGAHVFPGGRVDASDYEGSLDWCDGIDRAEAAAARVGANTDAASAESVAYHVAAARELFEEVGVLLARHRGGEFVPLAGGDEHSRFLAARHDIHDGRMRLRTLVERERLRLALDALELFAHWVTPPVDTRQFDTRFFIARVPPHQIPAHDETETTHGAWIRPPDAIAQAAAGEIVLPPPTWTTLRELEGFSTVDEATAWARRRRIVRRMPLAFEADGRRLLLLPGDPEHPDPGGEETPVETRFVLVDKRWRPERAGN
jgi:8-oxo-dGTP pyrophosphatase MutT (NUDIX family)